VTETKDNLPLLTVRLVGAYVHGNRIVSAELPRLIFQVHEVLAALRQGEPFTHSLVGTLGRRPAVPVDESVTSDYIISLEDGRRFKSLTRHLKAQYDLTPAQYRMRWNLPSDYPMVAPNYSRIRARIAKAARQRQLRKMSGKPEKT
jgi:predicted transcriptional regulator